MRSAKAWTTGTAIFYLLAVAVLLINQGLYQARLPALESATHTEFEPWGMPGLAHFAILSAPVLLFFVSCGEMSGASLTLAALTGAVFVPPSLSSLLAGGSVHPPSLCWAVVLATTAAAATLVPTRSARRLMFIGGGVWGYANLFVGLVGMLGLVSGPILDPDPRYAQWLHALGVPQWVAVGALGGIGSGRQPMACTLALLLALQVRMLGRGRAPVSVRTQVACVAGTTIPLLWSLSRTAIVAVAVGLLMAQIPWQRLRIAWATLVLTVGLAILAVLPLAGLLTFAGGSPGTWQWRLDIWSQLFHQPLFLGPFGLGPDHVIPLGASHTHNSVIEIVTISGTFGLLVAALMLVYLCHVALCVRPSDDAAAIAVLATFVMVGQTEMPLNFRSATFTAQVIVLIVVLGSSLGQGSLARAVEGHHDQPSGRKVSASSHRNDSPARPGTGLREQ